MKKMFTITICALMLIFTNQVIAQGNAEEAANDILKAYKTKDVALLKKYVTGFMVYAISDDFFEGKEGQPLADMVNTWDGNIKEIRYRKGDMMGKTVSIANAYFGDNPSGNLNVVMLTSSEGSDWKAFTYGIMEITKEEYNEYSADISNDEEKKENAPIDYSVFSIEMASGDKYEAPNPDKLKELLKSLNDDNFFLILNSKEGFLQVSTSEKGYIVQYSNNDGMFEAEAYFTFDKLVEIFNFYINSNIAWKEKAKWLDM